MTRRVHLAWMALVMACMLAFVSPASALAEEVTQTVKGTMTVKVQDATSDDSETDDATTTDSTTATTTEASDTSSGSTSSAASTTLTSTGDALLWLALGFAALAAGGAYVALKNRKPAMARGAHAGHSAKTQDRNKTVAVAVLAAVLAAACFSAYAHKANAAAEEQVDLASSTSAVTVDSAGNVQGSATVEVTNETTSTKLTVKQVESPASFDSWTTNLNGTALAAAESAEGTWTGAVVPPEVVQAAQANNGQTTVEYDVVVAYVVDDETPDPTPTPVVTALDFSKFTVDQAAKTYAALQITPDVSATEYEEGTDYVIEYGENLDAGTGTITIKGQGEYAGSEQTFTFKINKKVITITEGVSASSKTYDGSADATLDFDNATIDGLFEADKENLTVSAKGNFGDANAGENKNVAISNYALSGSAVKNYELAESGNQASAAATIDRAAINPDNIAVDTSDQEYTGAPIHPAVTMPEGMVENVDYTVTYGENTNPGEGTVKVEGIGNYQDTMEYTFNITGALTLDFSQFTVDKSNKTYDASQIKPEVTSTEYTEGTDYEIVYGENKNAGTGTITIKGKGAYSGEETYMFTIDKKKITVTEGVTVATKTYDKTTDATFDCTSATKDGLFEADKENVTITATGAYDVPDYKYGGNTATITAYTLSGDASKNYVIDTEASQKTATGQINKKTLTKDDVSGLQESYAYTGSQIKPTITIDGLTEGVDFNVYYSDNKEVGTGYVTPVINSNNYNGPGTLTFEITGETLDLSGATLEYTTTTYDGSQKKPTVTVPGKTEGVDFEVEYTYNVNATSSAYATVKGIGKYGSSDNQKNLTFTIEKADPDDLFGGTSTLTGLTGTTGDAITTVSLPTSSKGSWAWVSTGTISSGTNTYQAKFTPYSQYTTNYKTKTYDISITGSAKTYEVTDSIKIGTYPWNPSEAWSEVTWYVLAKSDDGKLLVSTNMVIDAQAYSSGYSSWSDSSLRTWLNGTFFNTIFSASEQAKIGTPSGATYGTNDNVFCLSESEANTLYYETSGGSGGLHKQAEESTYARVAMLNAGNAAYLGSYWLRSSDSTDYPPAVNAGGDIVSSFSASSVIGVRPCMWYDPS